MRTSPVAAVACLLAAGVGVPAARAQESSAPSRFELFLSPEVTLVGPSAGLRPELLMRLGDTGPHRLRLAPGLLQGFEFTYIPVALGYRASFRDGQVVRPLLGAGLEYQHRFVSDAEPAQQLAFYLEAGATFAVTSRLSLGLAGSADVTFRGGPGAGLNVRALVGWAL